ncbi:MAG: hypothetical protein RBQ84_06755 [Arcobacter sp.]|jgi:hypothetical protein|uniref:hypothetical protein n=1 Tax=Arcobacter sp. TaxID=1872629 RepID=UPI002A75EBBB|nr:hypothetical protein [Arcobacter sp.]MDY3200634.1 hypothetical protein [Arcobacter sp.]
MGMFDVEFQEEINLKEGNKSLFEFVKKQFLKDKEYDTKIEKESLSIPKSNINTYLRYNLKITTSTNKKDKSSQVLVNAELHDTLILAILVILAIPFTYGIGIIFIIIFTYYQKVQATKYLKNMLTNYKSTI